MTTKVQLVAKKDGLKTLFEQREELANFALVNISNNKEDALDYLEKNDDVDIVMFTDNTPSSTNITSEGFISEVRQSYPNIRIIFFGGDIAQDPSKANMLSDIVKNGVYDIVLGARPSVQEVIDVLKTPRTYAAVQMFEKNISAVKNDVTGTFDNVISFYSVKPGTGKSFVAFNVATAIAKFGQVTPDGKRPRVAIIDADLSSLSIGALMHIKNSKYDMCEALRLVKQVVNDNGEVVGTPEAIESIKRDIWNCFPQYPEVSNLYALIAEDFPLEERVTINPRQFYFLLECIYKVFDIVIVDMNSSMEHTTTGPLFAASNRIYFLTDPDFSVKSYKYTVMVTDEEGNVSYYNIDTNGDETSHRISGLVFGEKYTIKETYSPDGYFYVKDTEFTANKTNTITLTDNDIVYQINKVDNVDGSYVKGVQLKLIDITDKENQTEVELPNGGVTTGEAIILDKVLIADHTYNLIETELVGGVWRSTNIQFTVPHNAVEGMKTITVTMVDDITNTGIAKVDEDGNYVEGAKMQLIEIKSDLQNAAADGSEEEIDKDYLIDSEDATTDEVSNEDKGIATLNETGEDKAVADETTATDGEDAVATKPDEDTDIDTDFSQGTVVYEWTTSDKLEDVSKYVKGGYTYIVREVEAPFGFEVMKDIEFTSTGTVDEKQVIVATDQRKTYYVSGVKVDADDTSKYLEGAELTLYTADGKVAKDVNGKDCKATTVKNGVVTFEVEYNDDLFKNAKAGYYLKETKSPKHYQLNKNKFYVELSTDYSFAVNNPVKIIVKDKYDNYKKTAAGFGVGLGAIALASGAGIIATRKKKKDEEINENVD